MRSIESEGSTIDEAIENALRALEVERDRVAIDILADATRGVLGFGAKKARVRATVRAPLSTRPTDGDAADVSRETPAPAASRETATEPAARSRSADAPPRERRAPSPPRPPRVATPAAPTAPLDPVLESRCRDLTRELFGLIGVSCDVVVRAGSEGGEVVVEVTGDSGGLLIGRRGQTLDALEYMLNRIVSRGEPGGPRLVLDIEGYRERRRQYLDALAHRLADKARQTGRAVTLNPMSARDRRIVHLALHDDQTVATRSQGEGHFRRMMIIPGERTQRGGRPAGSAR